MWEMNKEDYYYCLCFTSSCMVFLILCQLIYWVCNRVKADKDHAHDHVTNDDHVVIYIQDFPGVNPSVLGSIPTVDFKAKDFRDGVDCVVCLSELADGDRTRTLPNCNHRFHADCIDQWFQLHSTCPICRNEVGPVQLGTRSELGGEEGLTTDVAVTQDTTSGNATSFGEHLAYPYMFYAFPSPFFVNPFNAYRHNLALAYMISGAAHDGDFETFIPGLMF